jgi:NTP pyrophosphatase (non-canonical NTP hydrolase)
MKLDKLERLALLVEECAEVQHIVMKTVRHGENSYNPYDTHKTPNWELLNKEIGDLYFVIRFLIEKGDIDESAMMVQAHVKQDSIQKYLHHNTVLSVEPKEEESQEELWNEALQTASYFRIERLK